MPFDTSTDTVADYSVRIFFEGLLMLSPTPDGGFKRCDVHVVNDHSADHELSVDVFLEGPHPNFPILRLGTKILHAHELEIAPTNSTPQGVLKYTGADVTGVSPLSSDFDFKRLHPGVSVRPANEHRSVIRIKQGVLHTAIRKTPAWLYRNTQFTPIDFAGLVLGIRMRGSVKLSWNGNELVLPRLRANDIDDDDDATSKYVILVNHGRPVPTATNDSKHLYHALTPPIPDRDEYELRFMRNNTTATTPRIPCIPGVTDG